MEVNVHNKSSRRIRKTWTPCCKGTSATKCELIPVSLEEDEDKISPARIRSNGHKNGQAIFSHLLVLKESPATNGNLKSPRGSSTKFSPSDTTCPTTTSSESVSPPDPSLPSLRRRKQWHRQSIPITLNKIKETAMDVAPSEDE